MEDFVTPMLFDGSTTRKRIVSLGGRKRESASESSRDIVHRAREERAKRQYERDLVRCATRTQAVARGARATKNARSVARKAFVDAYGVDGTKVADAAIRDPGYLRSLVYFGNGREDWRVAAGASRQLVASASASASSSSSASDFRLRAEFTALCASAGEGLECESLSIRLRRFVRLLIGSLRETVVADAQTEPLRADSLAALSDCLIAFMRRDDPVWGDSGVALVRGMTTKGDLEALQALCVALVGLDAGDDQTRARRAVRLTCENVAMGGCGDALGWVLATVPGVWRALGEYESIDLWKFTTVRLASEDARDAEERPPWFHGADVALANILQPLSAHVDLLDVGSVRAIAQTITRLVLSPHLSAHLFAVESNSIEDELDREDGDMEDADDDEKKVDVLNLRMVRAQVRRSNRVDESIDLAAVRQTQTFVDVRRFFSDASCVSRFMAKLLPTNDVSACLESAYTFAALVSACETVLKGAEREMFMRSLTFGVDYFVRLWPALVRLRNVEDRKFRQLLGIFAKSYNMYTMISDDEEFYRLGKPLGLQETAVLVGMLRDTLWQLLWVERGPDGTPIREASIMDEYVDAETWHACSSVIARLHDRNGRQQFVDPVAFQMHGNVDIQTLLLEARESKSRASMLLSGAPCLVPFEARVYKFMDVRRMDRQRSSYGYATIRVRRGHLLEDGMNALSSRLTETLGGIVRVQFVNQQGLDEAGVDGGGLFKDFLNDLITEAFDPKFGLFLETPERMLYPNPASEIHAGAKHLEYFYFLGAILGKAVYEGILLDVPLAGFFLASLKGRHIQFNDLTTLDPELYRNLVSLKRYQGDVEDLCLYFTAMDRSGMEETEIELIPHGASTPVTRLNLPRYLHCMSMYLLRVQMHRQLASMKAGFEIMMTKRWLNMFTPAELRLLISGNRTDAMNIADMAANSEFSGGYDASHPVIGAFWEVMKEITPEEQRQVLKFITACSNTPLLGFSHLEPRLTIHRSGTSGIDAPDTTADLNRLPTAATCMNLLKLPPYSSKQMLKDKLLYAVKSGSGFDLS